VSLKSLMAGRAPFPGPAKPSQDMTNTMNGSPLTLLGSQHTDIAEAFGRVSAGNLDRSAELAQLVSRVASHVAVVRTYLYPLARRIGHGRSSLARALLSDCRKLQILLVRIDRRKVNSPDMPDLVTELIDAFEQHQARLAVISSHIEEHFEQQDLDALARQMARAKRIILSHPHPFLFRLGGPLYARTTRIASRWDSWRDRTVRNR
jgi:hypothetical protein